MVLLNRRKLFARLSPSERAAAKDAYRKCAGGTGAVAVVGFAGLYAGLFLLSALMEWNRRDALALEQTLETHSQARLLNATNGSTAAPAVTDRAVIGPPNFPPYWISPYDNGGVIVYIIGMIYTFMGLAVVCDEFFVPALEIMIEKFEISEDVAGATLMAAGGSAPELTTSLIGTFLSESDVGFGTIVGSAVFNVLFVIGMCAVFSKEVLVLTWWPLARDSSYYIFSLGLLALFFGGPYPASAFQIEFWEALILFFAYLGYVFVMSKNVQLQKKVSKCCGKKPKAVQPMASYVEEGDAGVSKDGGEGKKVVNEKGEVLPSNPLIRPTKFRAGVLQMVLQEQDEVEQLRVKVVAQIVGDVHDTFAAIDTDSSEAIDKSEFRELIRQLTGGGMPSDEINATADEVFSTIDLDGDKKVSFLEFKHWYMKSETRVMNDVKTAFDKIDVTEDGFVEQSKFMTVVEAMGMKEYMTEDSTKQAEQLFSAESDESKKGYISFEQFIAWYRSSMLWEKHAAKNEGDAEVTEESEGLDLSWPSTGRARLTYIVWAPILIPLGLTIPDCRKEHLGKYYMVTFFGSIVWVAIYSYFMVWFATLTGSAANISDYIMGLTFLAAGTSVPDLLTSVIVARQGHGDMAVSSSIGSNIFDITVGLPVPWMLSTIIRWKPQVVSAQSLLLSVFTLMLMLGGVIVTIALCKWRMTKTLGGIMFGLYGLFLFWDLAREYKLINVSL